MEGKDKVENEVNRILKTISTYINTNSKNINAILIAQEQNFPECSQPPYSLYLSMNW